MKLNDLAVTTAKIANNSVTTGKISATGSASATTFLRGDDQWATPASSSWVFATNNTLQIIPVGSATNPVEFF